MVSSRAELEEIFKLMQAYDVTNLSIGGVAITMEPRAQPRGIGNVALVDRSDPESVQAFVEQNMSRLEQELGIG